ncbi:accessory factor associated with RNA polymerase II [Phlyctochytrium bullatum]|nr:accessory factor associated with RNA polymerase II [Phlyctochytrium bullatum]
MTNPPLPVVLLRKAHLANADLQPQTATGSPATGLGDTHTVLLDGVRFPVDTPSGYKDYPLQTLLFFLEHRLLEQAAYMQTSVAYWEPLGRMPPLVRIVDRRDLLEYLTGASEESSYLRGVVGKAVGIGAEGNQIAGAKRPGEDLDSEEFKKKKLEYDQDKESLKDLLAREKTLVNHSTFMSMKMSKGFTLALQHAADFLGRPLPATAVAPKAAIPVPAPAPASSKGVPRPPGLPSSSSRHLPPAPGAPPSASRPRTVPSALPPVPSSSSRDKRPSAAPSKIPGKPGKPLIPIIMVPAALQSTLTLYNVKTFLVDGKWVPTEEFLNKGDSKPPFVEIERKPGANAQTGPRTFHVYDSVDKLRSEDWNRIVAVFATGQEWQFKNWKFGAPVNIFSRVKGYCLKFTDEPPHPKIKTWSVSLLEIHRVRRHLDAQTVTDFWLSLDNWVREKKGGMFM